MCVFVYDVRALSVSDRHAYVCACMLAIWFDFTICTNKEHKRVREFDYSSFFTVFESSFYYYYLYNNYYYHYIHSSSQILIRLLPWLLLLLPCFVFLIYMLLLLTFVSISLSPPPILSHYNLPFHIVSCCCCCFFISIFLLPSPVNWTMNNFLYECNIHTLAMRFGVHHIRISSMNQYIFIRLVVFV